MQEKFYLWQHKYEINWKINYLIKTHFVVCWFFTYQDWKYMHKIVNIFVAVYKKLTIKHLLASPNDAQTEVLSRSSSLQTCVLICP